MQAAPKEDEPLNNKSRANSRANILNSSLPGHYNLSGAGVVVGVGDALEPTQHIDFTGRLINRSAATPNNHGLHVMGTVGAAGLVREEYAGYAPKATLVAQQFAGILAYTPDYIQDYGMVITNNSYGNTVDDCVTFGQYDFYARMMDLQMIQYPNLQHVFAVGNSGLMNCSPYLPGFANVLGGYQTAKNTIQVGNANTQEIIDPSSSKGPVKDGRIKPEITAQGIGVLSTIAVNRYGSMQGTSMAAPAVSGGLALLYERYRQSHGGTNPKNGLMKALLVNGATDKGNPGPDFSYGFGWLNLLRSVRMLDNASYYNSVVSSGATNTHTITIPAGASIAQLKVMLYWNDAAANIMAAKTLVNDLDLTVTEPSGTIHLPYVLDSSPSNVNNAAVPGIDNTNNIEQVVIDNPTPGNYTFSVKGTTIPSGNPYEYFLVYDTIPVSTTLTYPVGGERLQGGDAVYIQWDSYGNAVNDFTIQYSVDNGANWTTVPNGANVSSGLRQLAWNVLPDSTEQARVKIIHNGTGIESISERFTVIPVPVITLATTPNQCEGYISIHWNPAAGATDYEVMQLQGQEWNSVAITTDTAYI
ncbi:MAG: peptidase S8/S53 subtilisin kexin sedolisin, partial [Sphingobacteriales bacterium]